MHDIKAFFNSINFIDEENIFENVEINKVVLNKKNELFSVYLMSNKVLPFNEIDRLINNEYRINNLYKCKIFITYTNIENNDVINYVNEIIKKLVQVKPSLVSLIDNKPIIDDDIIIFEVISEIEEETIKKEEANIRKMLASFGLKDYLITTKLNEEKREVVVTELENVQAPAEFVEVVHEFVPGDVILGKEITKEPVDISSINSVGRGITIEGYVESISYLERDNINIITLSINDNKKSIMAKIFKKEKEEYLPIKNAIKEENWYRLNGSIDFDSYSKCLAMSVRNLESIESREIITLKNEDPNIIMGDHVDGEITAIENIVGPIENVIVEAYVFGEDLLEKDTINILTLKISDNTSSMLAKVFKKNKREFSVIKSGLKDAKKKKKWYRFHGNVEFDNYSHENVFQIWDIECISSKEEKIVDNAEVKRVELHAHTMMSMMDSVIDAKTLVGHAMSLGHKAVAVTDHNALQAYPDLFHVVCEVNKGKPEDEHFKVIYGTELNVVNDDIDFIHNLKEYNLLGQEYVVFDTETTGFYVGSDQMIEIGAVKIKDGEIIDRFDEFIDPHRPLPQKIIDLTCITDDMLKGHDDEETVTKIFLEWAGELPMVAHNAKFDIGFIDAACGKYNLGKFNNTVLDTMSMARTLHPEWPNHKLTTLVRRYNIEWDEDAHHRADYDAEGTALAFHKMCEELDSRNIETTTNLFNSVDINELIKFSFPFHLCCLVKNKTGLKNLFKIISYANTTYLFKNSEPKLPRGELKKLREGLLIGSGCVNGEIFEEAKTKDDEELSNLMQFYDYIEIQPLSAIKHLLQLESSGFKNMSELENHIKKIVRVAKDAGKLIVATSDAHYLTPKDKIYRDIIIAQKTNGKLHPLNKRGVDQPDMHFRTTDEMLQEFSFLGEDLANEIVVTNSNKIADMIEEVEVIIQTGGVPFSPKIDKSVETVTELVYTKAENWYGNPLPLNIEERISKELYGDAVLESIKSKLKREEKLDGEELNTKAFSILHETILKGFDSVKEVIKEELIIKLKKEYENSIKDLEEKINAALEEERLSFEEELKKLKGSDPLNDIDKKVKKALGGIIGGGFDVIYLIAQKLVKKSNDDGFLVGSRGSVGSSFVATMMGITEVNALPPHYRCQNCKHSIFEDENGNALGATYKSGFDLPDLECPKCGTKMLKDGQDMPFATFLGFNADKVPDIDLNFSDLNQAAAHEYTKVLFGVDNVYRAGTIGTVAEKTAFGFVRGYAEKMGIILNNAEIERLAIGCTGVKRTTGQHPGGIVVIPGYMDVFDFTPFQYPAEDIDATWRTTHFDYHAIDEDVLKLDILGHTDPTQLRMIQDISGIDVTTVPLDDKETMGIFLSPEPLGVTKDQIMNETGTLGVPEFGTPFTIGMLVDTKPKTFAELIKISGLSHGTDVWLGNAQELIRNNIVPFSDVIGCRDDIMVYLMYKGMEPIKAFKIMEFVRKGKASKDPEGWAKFKADMEAAGIESWYIDSCEKIKYMFPKAHAAAYVTSAFRIAYFKVHHPEVYYATYFSTRFDDFDLETMIKGYDAIKAKMKEIIEKGYTATNKELSVLETLKLCLEATARGFKFGNIDIEKSDGKNFIIGDDKKTLICPFRTLDGLGDSVATKIIEERNIKPFYSIEDFGLRGHVNQTTVDKLRSLGVFGNLPETSQLSLFDLV
ncbi:MAG: PolC-type DNA polymerase III [Firmicutes bacterium]|nr:PolC-type DNA polymerase III [Bacillota bacterium]